MRTGRFEHEDAGRAPRPGENVCGVLVRAHPGHAAPVRRGLAALPGTEVHHVTDDERLVVTVEETPENPANETMTAIHNVEGVLSVALVYHEQTDDPEAVIEEAS